MRCHKYLSDCNSVIPRRPINAKHMLYNVMKTATLQRMSGGGVLLWLASVLIHPCQVP